MRLHQLFEGLSSVLYHGTDLHSMLDILRTDSFRLTPDLGTVSDKALRSKGKIYYMSFSRSKVGEYSYPTSTSMSSASMIVVDGRALQSAGYSGKPVSYWGDDPNLYKGHADEMEDRLYSAKPYIPNASNYIREIHSFYNTERSNGDIIIRALRRIYILAKKLNIPFYIYSDRTKYDLLDKRYAEKIINLQVPKKKEPIPIHRRPPMKHFAEYMELLSVDDKSKLSKNALQQLSDLRHSGMGRVLSAEIHNARQGDARQQLDRFLAKLKQFNLTSAEEVIEFVKQKFDV